MSPPARVEGAEEVLFREYEPGDEEAILAAFNRVYAAIDPHFEPRSMAVWRWRYLENPAGLCISLALHPTEGVIAHYSSDPVRVVHAGRPATWRQVGDTFVDARFARVMRKPGLFFLVANHVWDHYAGPAPERTPVFYGLPTRLAHRIGQKVMAYGIVHDQNKLTGRAAELALAAAPGVEVEEVERFPEQVLEPFERLREEHGAIAVRDATYLNWRFPDHPATRYALALARGTGPGRPVRGLAVYRRGGFDGREDGLACDWAVPGGDRPAAAALLAWLRERTLRDGLEHLTAMIPEHASSSQELQRSGLRVRPTGYYCVARSCRGPSELPWLHRNWYYTLADFDLS